MLQLGRYSSDGSLRGWLLAGPWSGRCCILPAGSEDGEVSVFPRLYLQIYGICLAIFTTVCVARPERLHKEGEEREGVKKRGRGKVLEREKRGRERARESERESQMAAKSLCRGDSFSFYFSLWNSHICSFECNIFLCASMWSGIQD